MVCVLSNEDTSLADIADTLAENFSEVLSSRHYNAKFQSHKEHTESHPLRFNSNNTETCNTYFTMDELLDSLAKSSDSAVGPDDIHYQMLKHLPSDALQSLLNTLNDIWLTGNFPPSWRQSHIVPIPKAGKDSSDPSNYRPIARTSCVCTRHVQLQEHVEHQHQSCMAAHYMIINATTLNIKVASLPCMDHSIISASWHQCIPDIM